MKNSGENPKGQKAISEFPKNRKLFNVHLESEKYGLQTLADCIVFDDEKNEAYPVQAKYSFTPRKVYITQRYQLMLEAFLIQETFKKRVPFGFIKYLRSNQLVKVDLTSKCSILSVAEEIRSIIKNETIPQMTPYKKRCVDCCYKKVCWGL